MSGRPNVVLVLTDDQGYGDLGCHGNPIVKTPNLDRFHGDSVRLTDYHVGPTCSPTRAGLLTGHYANSTGVWHTTGGRSLLRKDEYTMANMFADAGYRTGMFGKWHLGDSYPFRPEDRGFQEVVRHGGGGVGNTPDYWGNDYFDDTYCANGVWTHYAGYCTDVWFNLGLDFIERHRDEPFFCYITTNAPHLPHIVDPQYTEPYLPPVSPNESRARYYGMLANIDENFGVLRDRLRQWGLEDNTVLIFMTDNGSAGGVDVDAEQLVTSGHNAGMRGKKGSQYDGGHRVPLLMRWPTGGLDSGRDVGEHDREHRHDADADGALRAWKPVRPRRRWEEPGPPAGGRAVVSGEGLERAYRRHRLPAPGAPGQVAQELGDDLPVEAHRPG